jgi:hypothetical protein
MKAVQSQRTIDRIQHSVVTTITVRAGGLVLTSMDQECCDADGMHHNCLVRMVGFHLDRRSRRFSKAPRFGSTAAAQAVTASSARLPRIMTA